MISMMHKENSKAISSTYIDRVIPEVQSNSGNLPLTKNGAGTDTYSCCLCFEPKGSKANLTKEDSTSVFDLTEDVDLAPLIRHFETSDI